MLVVGQAIFTDDIFEKHFVCDLLKCKGACCVEGDLGAPLEESEVGQIEANLEHILPYLSAEGKKVIEEEGFYMKDWEDDLSTTTIENRECVFAVYDKQHILHCGIEKAWKDGKSSFQKPISCHLYPLRVSKYGEYEALNYHQWKVCTPACDKGELLQVPVYQFLKNALVRKFGEDWYSQLEKQVKEKLK
ncbi:MAG TPA: DUF3109 domain-containing protein [Cytophagales bacterium]|nr:DUF3109 domain-containing protein [Cytophagales bacterium]